MRVLLRLGGWLMVVAARCPSLIASKTFRDLEKATTVGPRRRNPSLSRGRFSEGILSSAKVKAIFEVV